MAIYEEAMSMAAFAEDVATFFRQMEAIQDWKDARPAQRVAALVILCHVQRHQAFPTAYQVASQLGIPQDRVEKIFDGLEHAPYVLTSIENGAFQFMPSQTLAYVEPFEGE